MMSAGDLQASVDTSRPSAESFTTPRMGGLCLGFQLKVSFEVPGSLRQRATNTH